jgi:hypothetical protein
MTHHPNWTGKTVSVDFDGVLHTYQSGWTGPEPTDPPEPGALEFINNLLAMGLKPVIVSSRADSPEGVHHIEKWLERHNFPWMTVSHSKVQAIAYVDDRAVRYDTGSGDWDRVVDDIKDLADLGARRKQS